jgi:hypothetical protein
MFPIKVLKLFQGYDNQAATAVKHVSADKSEAAPVTDAGWPETDRRSRIADRRQQDRRMQQVSILLNTRKRRAADTAAVAEKAIILKYAILFQ